MHHRLSTLVATAMRLGVLALAVSAPLLAMPAAGGEGRLLVGSDIKATSGAGLVIVVGLKRAG